MLSVFYINGSVSVLDVVLCTVKISRKNCFALSHQMHSSSTGQTSTCLIRDLTICHHVCLSVAVHNHTPARHHGRIHRLLSNCYNCCHLCLRQFALHLTARSIVVGRRQRQRERSTWMLQEISPERADLARASHSRSRRLDQRWKVRCTQYSLLLSCF